MLETIKRIAKFNEKPTRLRYGGGNVVVSVCCNVCDKSKLFEVLLRGQ